MLYDVVAVNIKTSQVRILNRGKIKENADACVNMAVLRHGVAEEFFAPAPAGKYQDGDTWQGD